MGYDPRAQEDIAVLQRQVNVLADTIYILFDAVLKIGGPEIDEQIKTAIEKIDLKGEG